MSYEQLALFELTEMIVATAKRIADGEIVNADDKLDLAERMAEARRRMPSNQEYGNWWRSTGIGYSLEWRAVLVKAGKRITADGRPVINQVDNGGEFSIRRFAATGDGWITGESEPTAAYPEGDEWYTPLWLFDALGLHFDLDVCAPLDRTYVATPADRFYTVDDDGLANDWEGLVWCNPPYSTPEPWVRRMIEHDNGVLLSHVPINGLWALDAWDACDALRLFQGVEFMRPSGELQRPGYWLQLAAFGEVAAEALETMDERTPANLADRYRPSRVFRWAA